MRKLYVTVILVLFATNLIAQKGNTDQGNKINFGFDLFYDIWQNLPEGTQSNGLSLGNSIYAMYEKQIWEKNERFRIAMGGGITTHKLSTNSYIEDVNTPPITFIPIEDDIDYKKSKLVVNYLDFMFELRYKSPSKFRFALGAKIGFRLDSHTSYKGDKIDGSGVSETVKVKDVQFIEKIKFGPTLKIGYGFVNFNVYYSLTKLFTEENGPSVYPISVGITFNPF